MNASSQIRDIEVTRAELKQACSRLEALSFSSIGPSGKLKLIRANLESDSLTVTASSEQLFSVTRLGLKQPLAHVLLDLAQSQSQQCGDGGLLAVGLASRLILSSLLLKIPSSQLFTGIDMALSICEQSLRNSICSIKLSWSSLEGILAVVRAILAPCYPCFSDQELTMLCNLTLQV
jgi:chaperonin GroEL (HSP60 family)